MLKVYLKGLKHNVVQLSSDVNIKDLIKYFFFRFRQKQSIFRLNLMTLNVQHAF